MKSRMWLYALVLAFVASVGYAAQPGMASFSLVADEEGQMRFSYNLDDPDGAFFDTLRDAVRGHSKVQVKHQVTISPLGGLWGHVASRGITYYVSYDVLRELYDIGTTPDRGSLATQDEAQVRHLLLGVQDMPLLAANQMYAGQSYKVSVKVTIDATRRSRWTRWLPLKWFGRDEINVEAVYLAR